MEENERLILKLIFEIQKSWAEGWIIWAEDISLTPDKEVMVRTEDGIYKVTFDECADVYHNFKDEDVKLKNLRLDKILQYILFDKIKYGAYWQEFGNIFDSGNSYNDFSDFLKDLTPNCPWISYKDTYQIGKVVITDIEGNDIYLSIHEFENAFQLLEEEEMRDLVEGNINSSLINKIAQLACFGEIKYGG